MNKIDKYAVGLSGEYAVASELCRRGVYANITLGNLKKTDLLAFSDEGHVARIEVKTKRGRDWVAVKGIPDGNNFLIFVDYYNKNNTERPDFYVLTSSDWRKCIQRKIRDRKKKGLSRVEISDVNSPIFPEEITRNGNPREGMTVPLSYVEREKDQWVKILQSVTNA